MKGYEEKAMGAGQSAWPRQTGVVFSAKTNYHSASVAVERGLADIFEDLHVLVATELAVQTP